MPLIVLEGIDGSGKSTQITLLRKWFAEQDIATEYVHFPRFSAPVYGDLIARFLRGELGDIEQVSPYLVALLFAGDRGDAGTLIKGWLDAGLVVLLDRYVYSNIAFQGAKITDIEQRNLLKEWILKTEFVFFNIPKPDLSLFLDVPFDFTVAKLVRSRDGDDREYLQGAVDIHEQSTDFQLAVRDVYMQLTDTQRDMVRIDCTDGANQILSANEISAKIIEQIKAKI